MKREKHVAGGNGMHPAAEECKSVSVTGRVLTVRWRLWETKGCRLWGAPPRGPSEQLPHFSS